MWFSDDYRRHLCDMHIADWRGDFLSQFDPDEYFRLLRLARVTAPMLYYQSHLGLCYFPTSSARTHAAFIERPDAMKRLTALCRGAGMHPIGYYSLNYNTWAHDEHPEWRMVGPDGRSTRENGSRYGLCCPNNGDYREFVFAQLREMSEFFRDGDGSFLPEGMFFDMPFWPMSCYCPACRERYARECGGELPTDRASAEWQTFAEAKRRWMGEWAQTVYDYQKKLTPGVSVEQNFACAVLPSGDCCIDERVNDACDYTGGDLYGGFLEQSFTCKMYYNMTKNRPFEYMCGRCDPNLSKHTITKSRDQLTLAAMLTCAHHGATLYIDAVDPVGTMDERVYKLFGEIFAREERYEPFIGPETRLREDVGVYYSLQSKYNLQNRAFSNHDCAVQSVKTMIGAHIPVGVATSYQLAELSRYKLIVGGNLNRLPDRASGALIDYVRSGGILYLSNADEPRLMRELLGAEVLGHTAETVTYLAPKPEYESALGGFTAKYPLPFDEPAAIISGIDESDVLAHVTLPYTVQNTPDCASIHSNPPGVATSHPALVMKKCGAGRVIWCAMPLEKEPVAAYGRVLREVFALAGLVPSVAAPDAPPSVELVTFDGERESLLTAVAISEESDAVRVAPFDVSVAVPDGKRVASVELLPERAELPFAFEGGRVTFPVSEFKIASMYRINYREV